MAPFPPTINSRVLLWAGCENNQVYRQGEEAHWECVQSRNDFPSTKEEQITGTGQLPSKPGLNLPPDSSVTLGKLLPLSESPLSYPQARIIKVSASEGHCESDSAHGKHSITGSYSYGYYYCYKSLTYCKSFELAIPLLRIHHKESIKKYRNE